MSDENQWHAHGNDAPSRGPERVDDGMAEPDTTQDDTIVGPDGEVVDPDVTDGGQTGQDSGSMA
ncbi:hypothetical protein [Lapillicoccus jejuensis]|uniref:Uncharacterized protein n=1 Tax=Lapillicoccus jejuensis TaxID=402171 RepID=A0A542E6C4_9MICO|nr:hypothetical protein [Lapillicoccus jejuensis]TQJ10877.1 hypothetical protein FB458_4019 [Lapillicoccus jejuensis]